MPCSNCGEVNPPEARFCRNCGSALVARVEAAASAERPTQKRFIGRWGLAGLAGLAALVILAGIIGLQARYVVPEGQFAVVTRFGTVSDPPLTKQEALAEAITAPPDLTSYHAAFDRGRPIPGQELWNLLPPDGSINAIDIGELVVQFGHTCA